MKNAYAAQLQARQMRRDMETASHQLIVRLKQIMGGESE